MSSILPLRLYRNKENTVGQFIYTYAEVYLEASREPTMEKK